MFVLGFDYGSNSLDMWARRLLLEAFGDPIPTTRPAHLFWRGQPPAKLKQRALMHAMICFTHWRSVITHAMSNRIIVHQWMRGQAIPIMFSHGIVAPRKPFPTVWAADENRFGQKENRLEGDVDNSPEPDVFFGAVF